MILQQMQRSEDLIEATLQVSSMISPRELMAASRRHLKAGQIPEAIKSAGEAVVLLEDTAQIELWSEALALLAEAERVAGNAVDAEEHLRHAIELRQTSDKKIEVPLPWFISAAQLALDRRDTVLALWTYESALESIQAQAQHGADGPTSTREEARVRMRMAQTHLVADEVIHAKKQAREAFHSLKDVAQAVHDDVKALETVFRMLLELGALQRQCGDDAAATESFHEAVDMGRDLVSRSRQTVEKHRGLSFALNRWAEALADGGDLEGSLAAYLEALEIRRQLRQMLPNDDVTSKDLSSALRKVSRILHAQGDIAAAYATLDESITVDEERLSRMNPPEPALLRMLATSYRQAAEWATHSDDDALDKANHAIEAATELCNFVSALDIVRQNLLTRAVIHRRRGDEAHAVQDEEGAGRLT